MLAVWKRMQQLPITIHNNMQQAVQTDATWNVQQCWEFLAKNVASVYTGLKTQTERALSRNLSKFKRWKLPPDWVKRKLTAENIKRKYKKHSKYKSRNGRTNLKLIETDCNYDFLKLLTLKFIFIVCSVWFCHEISAFYTLGVYQLRSPTNGRNRFSREISLFTKEWP